MASETLLAMRWPDQRWPRVPAPVDGYRTRPVVSPDAFARIQESIGWRLKPGQWEDLLSSLVPGSMIFSEHRASSSHVGVACAREQSATAVELAWVAVDPEHQGRGLATELCAKVVRHVLEQMSRQIVLTTPHDRWAALKTYLRLGFEPVIETKTRQHWRSVLRRLGRPGPTS